MLIVINQHFSLVVLAIAGSLLKDGIVASVRLKMDLLSQQYRFLLTSV